MLRRLAAVAFPLASPAAAQTIIDRDLIFALPGPNSTLVQSTTVMPFVKGACFAWRLRFDKAKAPIEVTEIFTVPDSNWQEDVTSAISSDGLVSTQALNLSPEDGWIENGWCVDEGEPAGTYLFEIRRADEVLANFEFEITRSD